MNVNVRYNHHETNISETFNTFLNDESYVDVVFVCDRNVQVKSHKIILTQVSDYLKQIIEERGEETVYISLPGVDSDHLKQLLNFLYVGEIKASSEEFQGIRNIVSHLLIAFPNVTVEQVDSISTGNQFVSDNCRDDTPDNDIGQGSSQGVSLNKTTEYLEDVAQYKISISNSDCEIEIPGLENIIRETIAELHEGEDVLGQNEIPNGEDELLGLEKILKDRIRDMIESAGGSKISYGDGEVLEDNGSLHKKTTQLVKGGNHGVNNIPTAEYKSSDSERFPQDSLELREGEINFRNKISRDLQTRNNEPNDLKGIIRTIISKCSSEGADGFTHEERLELLTNSRSVENIIKWADCFVRSEDGLTCLYCESTFLYDFANGDSFARDCNLSKPFRSLKFDIKRHLQSNKHLNNVNVYLEEIGKHLKAKDAGSEEGNSELQKILQETIQEFKEIEKLMKQNTSGSPFIKDDVTPPVQRDDSNSPLQNFSKINSFIPKSLSHNEEMVNPKKLPKYNEQQIQILEEVYRVEKFPGATLKKEIGERIGKTLGSVENWFRFRRKRDIQGTSVNANEFPELLVRIKSEDEGKESMDYEKSLDVEDTEPEKDPLYTGPMVLNPYHVEQTRMNPFWSENSQKNGFSLKDLPSQYMLNRNSILKKRRLSYQKNNSPTYKYNDMVLKRMGNNDPLWEPPLNIDESSTNRSGRVSSRLDNFRYKCRYCGKLFKSIDSKKSHMLIHGFSGKKNKTKSNYEKNATQGKNGKTQEKTDMTQKHDDDVSSDLSAVKEEDYQCIRCLKVLPDFDSFHMHILLHDVRPYTCDTCDKCFIRKGDLKHHMVVHLPARPFECFKCDHTFETLKHLKMHILIKHC